MSQRCCYPWSNGRTRKGAECPTTAQCSAAAKEAEERRAKEQKHGLLRSIYFLAKYRLPLTTTFDPLAQLQIAKGDELL